MKIPVRKKWGQNFLFDKNIQKKIVDLLKLELTDDVLEIGPGYGALTKIIAPKCKNLTGVEIDPLLSSEIENLKINNLNIINQDFLNFDLNSIKNNVKFVGNLPYYITTPILFKVLECNCWDICVFMTQKEVAERLTAKPGTKTYGRLTVTADLYCDIKLEFKVSRNVFRPKPDIDSAVISIVRKNKIKFNSKFLKIFDEIIKLSFSSRRKILRNTLKNHLNKNLIEKYGTRRPEECSTQDFIEIVNSCKE